jgi:hypothetical protein
VSLEVYRAVFNVDAGRLGPQVVVALPVPGRANWPWTKTATAVRTYVPENLLHTSRTEGALEAADARLGRVGRKRDVAVLAGGAKLEHDD